MPQFDVAVIGGGLVGASFVRAAADVGLKIAVIDCSPAANLYGPELDNRGLAIAFSSAQILQDLNIWSKLQAKAYPIQHVHVSEQNSFGFTKLSADNFKLPACGYVVSASALGLALIADLELLPNITLFRPEHVKTINFAAEPAQWELTLSATKIQAKLLVAADGSNSILRAFNSIPSIIKDYAQTAIVTNVAISKPNVTTAYERFTSTGVLALLPFGSRQMKCIWTVDNVHLPKFMQLSDVEFTQKIQQAIGFRLGKLLHVTERKTFPIMQTYIDQLYCNGCVFLGNAANTLHPVAAQGFNLGLRDAITLADILRAAVNTNFDFSSAAVLQNYATQRHIDHQRTRAFSNSLVEIFAAEQGLIKTSRQIALAATQFLPRIKRKIMQRGLGLWM